MTASWLVAATQTRVMEPNILYQDFMSHALPVATSDLLLIFSNISLAATFSNYLGLRPAHNCAGLHTPRPDQSRWILTTQTWKQTLPPSDHTLYYTPASDCKYLSCKIRFNVLNYVFILSIFNLYCLVNIQQQCHNSSHCDCRHHI